jgi:hypothetical protein
VRTVQTVVGTVKEKRGGSVIIAGDDVEPITKVLDQVGRSGPNSEIICSLFWCILPYL